MAETSRPHHQQPVATHDHRGGSADGVPREQVFRSPLNERFQPDPHLRIPNWLMFALLTGVIAVLYLRSQGVILPSQHSGAGTAAVYEQYIRQVATEVVSSVGATAQPADVVTEDSDATAAATAPEHGQSSSADRPLNSQSLSVTPPSEEAVAEVGDEVFNRGTAFRNAFSRADIDFSVNPDVATWSRLISWMDADPGAPIRSATDIARVHATPLIAVHVTEPQQIGDVEARENPKDAGSSSEPEKTTPSESTADEDAPNQAQRRERTALVTGLGQIQWLEEGAPLPDWAAGESTPTP